MTSRPVALVWLRHTLRLHDNPMLRTAIADGFAPVCVYIDTPREHTPDRWANAPLGPFRQQFLKEALIDLRQSLAQRGGALLYTHGHPADELLRLVTMLNAERVYADREYAYYEQREEDQVQAAFDVHWFHSQLLTHPDDVPFDVSDTPDVFGAFRRKVEKQTSIRTEAEPVDTMGLPTHVADLPEAQAVPQIAPLVHDPRSVHPFSGGETSALARLNHYLWESKKVRAYKKTRNGLIGTDYSTKFSAFLAMGCLSPKRVYHEIKRFEREVVSNQSTYWVLFEVLWREFFRYVAMKQGRHLFVQGGIQSKWRDWQVDERLERWKTGETGQPFVDANMRELRTTGFMSNRGRQNVASYLVHDLKQDWRAGASWFEHWLVDYDPCSNYGNWNYVAGIGNDPKEGRRFDPVWQSERYDSKGQYRELWRHPHAAPTLFREDDTTPVVRR